MKIKGTIVFKENWDAVHEKCPSCNGNDKNCDWCDGTGKKYKYIINEGTSRSSKTYSLIDCIDFYAKKYNNKRGTIWRETKADARRTVLQDIIKHHKNTSRWKVGYEYNKTESIFNYTNGSIVEIHGADEEDKVHGLTQDFAWLNEPYGISKEVFNQIDQRTSDFIFLDWNPKQTHFIDDLKKDRRTLVIWSTFAKNPFCPPGQKAKILSYQPISRSYLVENNLISSDEAKKYDFSKNIKCFDEKHLRELRRCVMNEERNSANDFNWCVYGLGIKGEKPNRIFNWNKINLARYINLDVTEYIGVDWGKVDPWAIVGVKYYDGELYLHEYNYLSENELLESLTTSEIKEITNNEEGIVSWLFNQLKIDFDSEIICDSNRPEKIIALRRAGWEYSIAARKNKGSILDGIDALSRLKVLYTESSKNIENEQFNYSWKTDRYGITMETPEDQYNHSIDAVRYVVSHLKHEGIVNVI